MTLIPAADAAGHTDYRSLASRMGYDLLERRIEKQAGLWARETHQGEGFIFMFEGILPVDEIIWRIIRLCGLGGVARRNCLDLRVEERELSLPGLPPPFLGFRLLQLSDLHCDLEPRVIDVLLEKLEGLDYDAVVLTGDYHNKIGEDFHQSLDLMGRLIPRLRGPRFGILGNHDFIEQVVFLESAGLPMLLNEGACIEKDGSCLWICGVDDPHFFRTENLAASRAHVPPGETAILLSHSPEPYLEAESLGFAAMLCGHTHGGQICLPGGLAVMCNMRAPREFISGAWRHGRLQGHTSRGTGSCGVPARFFCPPEITVHVLK